MNRRLSLFCYSFAFQFKIIASHLSNDILSSSERKISSEFTRYRKLEDIETIENSNECKLITSFKTQHYTQPSFGGRALGIMFTLMSDDDDIEILSLEFGTFQETSLPFNVQVYYKQGGFIGFHNIKSAWNQVASTQSRLSPDKQTAIVPFADFKSIPVKANTEYSLYITVLEPSYESSPLKVKLGPTGIQNVVNSIAPLRTSAGILLTDGHFPPTMGSRRAEFEGVLHYSIVKDCTAMLTSTTFSLDFAVNVDPTDFIITKVNQNVEDSMQELIMSSDLSRYKKSHLLSLGQVSSAFATQRDECPEEFKSSSCSIFTVKIKLSHLKSIDRRALQKDVMLQADSLANYVTKQNDFDVVYIGLPVAIVSLRISLHGLSRKMNYLQKQYFERVSSDFFSQFSNDIPIYGIEVADNYVEYFCRQLEQHKSIRDSASVASRWLAENPVLQVDINVYGSGSQKELKSALVDIVVSYSDRYIQEIRLQHLRPGVIKAQGDIHFESFFDSFDNLNAEVLDDDGILDGESEETIATNNSVDDEMTFESLLTTNLLFQISLAGAFVAITILILRSYMDFYQKRSRDTIESNELSSARRKTRQHVDTRESELTQYSSPFSSESDHLKNRNQAGETRGILKTNECLTTRKTHLSDLKSGQRVSNEDSLSSNLKDERQPWSYRRHPPMPMRNKFTEGQLVCYRRIDGTEKAKILKVHLDDDLEPFYTIRLLKSGREKQTDLAHLKVFKAQEQAKASAQALQINYFEGQFVSHKSKGSKKKAQILKVHMDDDLTPYYTIRLTDSGKEKQTDNDHLENLKALSKECSSSSKSKYIEGQLLFYKSNDSSQKKAEIVQIHMLGNKMTPSYTIRLLENREEKKTDESHLSPIRSSSSGTVRQWKSSKPDGIRIRAGNI